MIDFSTINAFNKGPRESFEDLICVLARREKHENGIEYQSNDGCGGDGGVEAIWILNSGRKIGYQAKYFLSIDDSQWQQMDKSVRQALKVHPELQEYVFALSKDLTPTRGTKGKSQREKWDEHVIKWKGWAAEKAIEINFRLWSETDLRDMLLREGNSPLVKYWFGKVVLNDAWFQNQVDVAKRTLDDRFNPNDHVEVTIEALFDTLTRGPRITKQLINAFNELTKTRIPNAEFLSIEPVPGTDAFSLATKALSELIEHKDAFQCVFSQTWDTDSTVNAINSLREAVSSLENQYSLIYKNELYESDSEKLKGALGSLRAIYSAVSSLNDILCHPNVEAEAQQCAMIHGPAGAGKSHILGQIAEQRESEGLPTILVLGQSFSNSAFWVQLADLLGIEGKSAGDVLGLLNAAGERIGKRTLLLFDAINEGVGAQYWRQNLAEFVNEIKKFPYLAAVFSCREEYLPYSLPGSLKATLPKFKINGFSTPKELERAAIRYLDTKGIARPNTPWLSPEFSNPLFLKSTSEALLAKGKKEFPRGLTGISQIMVLYLDALSWRTGVETADSSTISKSILQCVRLIANKMAADACDYVELEQATTLAKQSFKDRTPPEGKTWLEVLIQTSLFRRDPPPYSEEIDPFNPPSELIRFAFQRFQDHLMATALVEKLTKEQASKAFNEDGPLNFLFYSGNLEHAVKYKYAGLVSALSTVYPEKLKLEFAKTLPNWEQHWQEEQLLQVGFGESFKWRNPDAFTDSTRELLNRLDDHYVEPLGLLLEVSMTIEHPFNAMRLHTHLVQFSMPERDHHWTRWINWASREEFSQIDRVVSWALSVSGRTADVKHMELASIVLVWSLSSSHKTLRDRATKALTKLFLSNLGIYGFLLDKMHDCNDPYVIERLYAAAFGACCIEQSNERLSSYSEDTYTKIFADKKPPVALLTRDYALGIIELADAKGALCDEVILENCYPPFKNNVPKFDLNNEEVEAIAEACGGKQIFDSASSEWGDYGKYSIPGRVDSFLTTALDKPAPISKEKRKHRFIQDVIQPYSERIWARDELEKASLMAIMSQFANNEREDYSEDTHLEEEKNNALRHLEDLLNEEEQARLKTEYFDEGDYEEFNKVDVQQCRLWITKRAYDLGWSSKLFPRDGNGSTNSRHENDLERIGKKYQRIALDELQARLADNFWYLQGWPEQPYIYRYSHQDFRRNIEPTILPNGNQSIIPNAHSNIWMTEPNIKLPEVNEEYLKLWPFDEDPTQSMKKKIVKVDKEGKSWLVLYEFNLDKQKYDEPCSGEHGLRYEEFRFFYCLFVKRGKAEEFSAQIKSKQSVCGHSYRPVEFTDGPYLREAYWRETWPSEKYTERSSDECEFAIPVVNYIWESHLDKSLPDGFSLYMPQKWLADELKISMSEKNPHQWIDHLGNIVVQANSSFEEQTSVIIDEDVLNSYSEEFGVEPVWLMIAERSAFPNGSNKNFCGRRAEGVVWKENGCWKQVEWNKDTKK
ncbi:ATP-binding protein [Shewanella sp. 3_MG-2023]|uniref:ATP-binding protein n=1 Tax=Shewanella sp. 3_MG-2023 TaxID=3062635 RepID=UPI0026E37717|nr:ATP-binding protein [Shewanella sp. 3_MG-2023]MDO6775126.1 ATP-binding protein [Shewanella sp. 3_MG-2023]